MQRSGKKGEKPFSLYKEHPKTCAPDDFWGQVKRTVNGQPVPEDQIAMIEEAIFQGLTLKSSDKLLDLCCGNGALTDRILDRCAGGVGVDFSEKLIETAHTFFQAAPERRYVLSDVVDYVRSETTPESFTKILCYGSFAYLEADRAEELLHNCFETYYNASIMFIGNCPDKSQMNTFFTNKTYTPGIEDKPDSAIGIWRTKDEFEKLAECAGWKVTFLNMPPSFYASGYRYDVVLKRPAGSTSVL